MRKIGKHVGFYDIFLSIIHESNRWKKQMLTIQTSYEKITVVWKNILAKHKLLFSKYMFILHI
ncbi:hypothetical protein Hanom_Chr16g01513001 [Helianthus anomalus]